ncbi:MAG: EAL domain-containing protein [Ruminococcus sp.]|jgi:EAL domain-containing protein (putative c-di-GMP-specific phosphodiesterase class I)/CheY-like chemotaxis protein|nr:EAL domain-containing protein [Ruminococcus sp.]
MENIKPLILVVEDQKINRDILNHILKNEYNIIEAENGAEALDIFSKTENISAILLDINMPVMDGYTFLSEMNSKSKASVPVIAVTASKDSESEQKVLELGAWDYISKPYIPQVLLARLKNVIIRTKFYLIDKMKHIYEHDLLTDLYQRTVFFSESQKLINNNDEKFALIRLDVDDFHLLNSFWGEHEGDRFLCFIADEIRKLAESVYPAVYGRINADIFGICMPFNDTALESIRIMSENIRNYKSDYLIKPSSGIYIIDDKSIKIETMYEYATLAAKDCKSKFNENICYYKPEMQKNVILEQSIINEMQSALNERQFEVFLQPKYNLETETPYGAEALVRWRHPQKGLISPGVFIPVFERNGFIGKIDYYMWESVCKLLRQWLDEGKNPAPVSVNVSRVNMYNPNLVELFTELIRKYNLPPNLLNLELTESAYMQEPDLMKKTVNALQNAGFTVMMDDFGSGYSSLNTLKDIHVDVLKIDMKFLSKDSSGERGKCILTSMIRMAGWLGVPVIMEGAETLEQINFLKSIGCEYVQGYYFAKPMPVNEYVSLVSNKPKYVAKSNSENHDVVFESIWSDNPSFNLIFNSFKSPAAIYEQKNDSFRAIKMNSSFNDMFGFGKIPLDSEKKFKSLLSPEDFEKVIDSFRNTAKTRNESSCNYVVSYGGSNFKVNLNLQYWGKNQKSSIIFAVFNLKSASNDD